MKSLPGVAIMPPDAVAPGCPPLSRARPACDLTATFEESELLRDAGLPQHRIRGVPREDLLVYGKTPLGDWAVPDLMVSAAGSVKVTIVSAENLLHPWREAGHQDARTSLSSCSYRTWNFAIRPAGTPFSSSNSGMRILNFRPRLLGESASATRPGIPSLSATQTPASLSHRASTSNTSCEVDSCTNDRSLAQPVPSSFHHSITDSWQVSQVSQPQSFIAPREGALGGQFESSPWYRERPKKQVQGKQPKLQITGGVVRTRNVWLPSLDTFRLLMACPPSAVRGLFQQIQALAVVSIFSAPQTTPNL